MNDAFRVLEQDEIDSVSGGFVCGGLCVLGAISAGAAFLTAGIAVGKAIGEATK